MRDTTEAGVFAKCAVTILSLAAVSAGLLTLRQSRLVVAHDLAGVQLRVKAMDEELWRLRSQIASRVTPERIGALVSDVAQLHPLVLPPEPAGLPKPPLDFRAPMEGSTQVAENTVRRGRTEARPTNRPTGPAGPR